MSHHLDSPLARRDSRLNITDQYVFGATGATVFVLNAGTSLAGNENPSRFHPEGRYEIKVHLDDAPDEALTFRFTFAEADGDGQPGLRRRTADRRRRHGRHRRRSGPRAWPDR